MRPWVLRARPPTLFISRRNRLFSMPTTFPSESLLPIALSDTFHCHGNSHATLFTRCRCSYYPQRSILRRIYSAISYPCARAFSQQKTSRTCTLRPQGSPCRWHHAATDSRWHHPFVCDRSQSAGNARRIQTRDRSPRCRIDCKGYRRILCVSDQPEGLSGHGFAYTDCAIQQNRRPKSERIGARNSAQLPSPRWSRGQGFSWGSEIRCDERDTLP